MRVKGGEYKQPAVCLPFSLGVCYDNGKGVQQDKTEAVQRYRKDAEQADADAQFNLNRLERINQVKEKIRAPLRCFAATRPNVTNVTSVIYATIFHSSLQILKL